MISPFCSRDTKLVIYDDFAGVWEKLVLLFGVAVIGLDSMLTFVLGDGFVVGCDVRLI